MRPRLRSILRLHGDALLAAAQRREPDKAAGETPETLVAKFAAADPSANKSATQWLIMAYGANGFLLEDLGKATTTLTLFRRNKHRLPVPWRDLSRYDTLAAVWKMLKPFALPDTPKTGRDARRAEREAARAESRILVECGNGFTVVVPFTERSARWWGRGTRWCTSAREDNAFEEYNRQGPLIVIILPSGEKFQMIATDHQFHLMDDDDESVSATRIDSLWDFLAEPLQWAVTRHGRALERIPDERRTRDTCASAIAQNPKYWVTKHVPARIWDRDLLLAAIDRNGILLKHAPWFSRDREMCVRAVRQNGNALELVPSLFKDREICEIAVRQDRSALEHVPSEFQDAAMLQFAVTHHGRQLRHVPFERRTRELCRLAVSSDGSALAYVPESLTDIEICTLAVMQDFSALRFVPEHLRGVAMKRAEESRSHSPILQPDAICSDHGAIGLGTWDPGCLDELEDMLRTRHVREPHSAPARYDDVLIEEQVPAWQPAIPAG